MNMLFLIGVGVALLAVVALLLYNSPERSMQRAFRHAAHARTFEASMRHFVRYEQLLRRTDDWHDHMITAAHEALDRGNIREARRLWLEAGESEASFWKMMEE